MGRLTESHRYDDIIHLDRPKSNHQPMETAMRAAQFAPFAALSGHEEVIEETAERVRTMTEAEITAQAVEDI